MCPTTVGPSKTFYTFYSTSSCPFSFTRAVLWCAVVCLVHNSLETLNNPCACLGITKDETCWVLCFQWREWHNVIKPLPTRLSLPHLFTPLFGFLCSVTHLSCASSVCPHGQHQRTVKGSVQDAGEEWERVREAEEQVPGCFVGNTVKRSMVHGAPSAEHTSKPVLHLYCQHLEEKWGWCSLWAALGLYQVPLLLMLPLSSHLVQPNCLCARRITTFFFFFFTFAQFRLLLFY